MLLLIVVVSMTGCRSLRTTRQTRELSAARNLSLRGWDELEQKHYSDAELMFQRALEHSEADERAHWGMAEVLWPSGQQESAIAHMATAVKIGGESPELLVRLGEMYFEKGHYAEALRQADAALNFDRQHCGGWALRGRVLQRYGELDAALDSYHRALNQQANLPEVQLAVAQIYQQTGRSQRALHTLVSMMETPHGGDCAEAWLLKGHALAALGEQQDARICINQASRIALEDDTELLVELAKSQLAFGDLAEARHSIGRAMRHDPYNPQILDLKNELDASFQSYAATSSLVGYGKRIDTPPESPPK